MRLACVDFDGVLHDYSGWDNGRLGGRAAGGLDLVQGLEAQGFEVVVHTSRDKSLVTRWLAENGFKPYRVSRSKPPAFVSIDDRALCYRGDVTQTLAEVKSFKAYWEK